MATSEQIIERADGYCSFACRDVHGYQQDVQITLDALHRMLSIFGLDTSDVVKALGLNHSYDEEDVL